MAHQNVSAIYAVLMSALVLLSAGIAPVMTSGIAYADIANAVSNTTSTQQPIKAEESACTKIVEQQEHARGGQLDVAKARALASSNAEYASRVQGFTKVEFHSIYNTWQFNTTNCDLNWETVNVVYSVHTPTGFEKYVVVTEDPVLSRVISISEQASKVYYDPSGNDTQYSTANSNYWSGYEFAGDSGSPPTTAVYESRTTWAVPSVSVPYSGACTSTKPCSAAIWPGLEDQSGAGNSHLVQGGTDSQITNCNTSCVTTNKVWYEFLPNSAVYCGGMTFATSDSVTADVVNRAKSGGSNTLYDVSINDNTSGQGCSVSGQSYTSMNKPIYGSFILERAQIGSGYTLANFGTVQIGSASTYYSSASHSIYTPYSNFWYVKWIMQNPIGSNTNIGVGAVDSTGSFTQTWWNSNGT
jgi:hypothetical protein